jgi:hypothetical protein
VAPATAPHSVRHLGVRRRTSHHLGASHPAPTLEVHLVGQGRWGDPTVPHRSIGIADDLSTACTGGRRGSSRDDGSLSTRRGVEKSAGKTATLAVHKASHPSGSDAGRAWRGRVEAGALPLASQTRGAPRTQRGRCHFTIRLVRNGVGMFQEGSPGEQRACVGGNVGSCNGLPRGRRPRSRSGSQGSPNGKGEGQVGDGPHRCEGGEGSGGHGIGR